MSTMPHLALDLEDLRSTVADVLDVEESEVSDDKKFVADLGADSLMGLEVMVVLERKYGVKFSEDELKQVTCLRDAYDLVAGKLAA